MLLLDFFNDVLCLVASLARFPLLLGTGALPTWTLATTTTRRVTIAEQRHRFTHCDPSGLRLRTPQHVSDEQTVVLPCWGFAALPLTVALSLAIRMPVFECARAASSALLKCGAQPSNLVRCSRGAVYYVLCETIAQHL